MGEVWFDGQESVTLRAVLPEGVLHDGANTLELTLPGDTGVMAEVVLLDGFGVTYQRRLAAIDDGLSFEMATGSDIHVSDLLSPNLVLYDIGGDEPARLTGYDVLQDGQSFDVVFSGSGSQTNYLLMAESALLTPLVEPERASGDITSQPADLLIISHPDFLADIEPLAEARRMQGYEVVVADVQDVHAQFGYDIVSPGAIRDYVAYAAANMESRYVLLVGGDTYDPLDRLGYGGVSFIPTPYAATDDLIQFAPADALLADLDGDDIPELPLGRLPVRSSAELQTLVDKILAYDDMDYRNTAVWAADAFDGDVSYSLESDGLIQRLPGEWPATRAYIDDLGTAGAKSLLIDAINQGTALTSYMGHSGYSRWSFSNLLSSADVAQLENEGRPTAVLQWGCWNTYFVHPAYNTMAHAFLLSGDRGAALVAGAGTLTKASTERQLADELVPLATQQGVTVGDAMLEAKQRVAAANPSARDVVLGWSLLGDPTQIIAP